MTYCSQRAHPAPGMQHVITADTCEAWLRSTLSCRTAADPASRSRRVPVSACDGYLGKNTEPSRIWRAARGSAGLGDCTGAAMSRWLPGQEGLDHQPVGKQPDHVRWNHPAAGNPATRSISRGSDTTAREYLPITYRSKHTRTFSQSIRCDGRHVEFPTDASSPKMPAATADPFRLLPCRIAPTMSLVHAQCLSSLHGSGTNVRRQGFVPSSHSGLSHSGANKENSLVKLRRQRICSVIRALNPRAVRPLLSDINRHDDQPCENRSSVCAVRGFALPGSGTVAGLNGLRSGALR